jgi:uncharacterized protein YndB with AHSA1/START domain
MDRTVQCEVLVKAPRERVFQAFVDIHELLLWFADAAVVGKREGGNWALGWYSDPDGDNGYHMMGTIETFDPGTKLVVGNLRFSTPEGNELGPMRLSISLRDEEPEGTAVTILQEGLQDAPAWHEYSTGVEPSWQRALEQLRGWLEEGRKLAGR